MVNYFPWAEQGSNLRTRERTDLQSVAFNRSAICPLIKSRRRESNPRPTDYKSVALPTELLRLIKFLVKRTTPFFRDGKSK